MNKKDLENSIASKREALEELSRKIWSNPELSLRENFACETYVAFLRREGFQVETDLAGISTAFRGTCGTGRPVIGFLGEFDALSGLSQKAGWVEKSPVTAGGCGHGCGHNLLGVGALAAAIAVKEYFAKRGSGTVVFYGCPGEEGVASKAFMAQKGFFKELDAALTWHPDVANEVVTGSCQASLQVEYQFDGIAAHAAGCPQMGRSALDGAELMNVGAQFLREHIGPADMVHYSILDAGGVSPNVVQNSARVLYMVRSDCVKNAREVLARVDNLARGAAIMTGTTFRRHFIDGTSNTLTNRTLEDVLYKNFALVSMPEYTEEEIRYAEALNKTCPPCPLPGFAAGQDIAIREAVEKLSDHGQKPINDFLIPPFHSECVSPGSTDVGDVSYITPTAQIHAAAWPSATPAHSWQAVSAGCGSIAHKAMLMAATVLACTAYDLTENPELLQNARSEFEKRTGGVYLCPIEPKTIPSFPGQDF